MITEIVTDPLSIEDLWFDLRENIRLLERMRVARVKCLFGYSWGNFVYSGRWVELTFTLDQVESAIVQYEKRRYGRLGDDNLYITIPELDVRLTYTYETDIHLSFSKANHLVAQIQNRWDSHQWLAWGQYQ